jgi:hypothetical protein
MSGTVSPVSDISPLEMLSKPRPPAEAEAEYYHDHQADPSAQGHT